MKTLQIWTAFLRQPGDYLFLSPTLLFCLLVLFGTVSVAGADDPLTSLSSQVSVATETPVEDKDGALPTLAPILVVAPPLDFTTGQTSLSSELIKQLPSGNGSIFELLSVLPGIQLTEKAHPSAEGGEIDPAPLSIAGGQTYQNTILLDGLSIGNRLDPLADSPQAANAVPERLQEIQPNFRIVETVEVFDHNIPARYGGFSGGVVKLQTRDPAPAASGSLNFRSTRDGWTRFHIAESNRAQFDSMQDVDWQPRFYKLDLGFDLNLPLGPRQGVFAAYQLVQSSIPGKNVDEQINQARRQENYFLKWAGKLSSKDRLEVAITSTPFRGDYFLSYAKNSGYTIDKKAYVLNSSWRRSLDWGEMELSLGYGYSQTSRSAPDNFFTWIATDSKDWGRLYGRSFSTEGGYGDLATNQHQYQVQTHWEFSPWSSGPLWHTVSAGMELERTEARSERKNLSYNYWKPDGTDPSIVCGDDDPACVDGDQFSKRRTVYGDHSVKAALTVGSFYLEDKISWRRLELRPGVRLTRNDYLSGTTVGHRLASSLDLFGTRGTILVAGLNRYYSLPVLAYKLRQGQPFWEEKRVLVTDAWVMSKTTQTGDGSDLKTPYVDELTAGVNQDVLGGRLRLDYIRREGRDLFAKGLSNETINGQTFTTITPNNNGRSHHESYSATWERSWLTTLLSLNMTYQQSAANVEGYDATLYGLMLDQRKWYKGEVLSSDEVPRKDFNRSWVANLILVKQLPFNVEFTNVTKFRSGYHYIGNTGIKAPAPNEDLYIYDDIHKRQSWLFDWKIAWRKQLAPHFEPALIVEVDNVFNRKILVGSNASSREEYEQGRQFWAGMECKF